ncbi:hypothetical protein EGN72_16035 [Pseudorhodobacter sp. E13]|nr:hypothetical protein EGN72_16035 [Pseudorhodobacter sp. E13]
MQYDQAGTPIVIVEQAKAQDLSEVIRLAPALSDPHWVRAYARVANHLAQGDKFSLIVDPAAFEAEYRAAFEAEDPDEVPQAGVMRLRNFGMPDFAAIKPPEMQGGTLVYFARNTFMGIPYRAVMPEGGQPEYEPVAMVE